MTTTDHPKKQPKAPSQSSLSQQPLVTTKSLALSLSAPRAPPYDSIHRHVLLGRTANDTALSWSRSYSVQPKEVPTREDEEQQAHSFYAHDTLRQRLTRRLHPLGKSLGRIHPHLPAGPEWSDYLTRTAGVWLSPATTNALRDNGTFRGVCDGLVTLSAPLLAVAKPTVIIPRFYQLSQTCQRIVYGQEHPRQYMDLYVPSSSSGRLLVLIHGGAWGSGLPWMYRLCATPFLQQGFTVCIPAYRTYPDGTAIDQVHDVERALTVLQHQLVPQYHGQTVTLMGHSSGAHVALLLLAQRAVVTPQSQQTNNSRVPIHAFVGLSGPYDISHHFDYEAARGVEELSPMKAACGYTRSGFRQVSPAWVVLDSLEQAQVMADAFPPRMLLLHAVEDETVPFTSTAVAARTLRACGVHQCQEYYVGPGTSHQDTILQFMMGGPSCDAVLSWLREEEDGGGTTTAPVTFVTKSKL